jgi:ketosteroid isomerase-like protein
MLQRLLFALALIALGNTFTVARAADVNESDRVIALERGALDRWGRGDPGGYLELYSRDVTYFDPQRERRIDGLDAMRQALEPIRGLVKIDRYEMIAPNVSVAGDVAILTYNLVSHGRSPDGNPIDARWNSTAVYRRIGGTWRIVHSHWSFTKPELKNANTPRPQ